MKIFILEDDLNRIEWFRKVLPKKYDCQLIFTDCAEDAKFLLKMYTDISVLFLDHDLGGNTYVSSEEENTGAGLARWIVKEDLYYDQIIIHSMNSTGSENIFNTLKNNSDDVRKTPFSLLTRCLTL